MDISSSSSSSDEGEITNSSGSISADRQVLAEFDNSLEDYEPQLESEVTLTQKADAGSSSHSEDDQLLDSFTAEPAKVVSLTDIDLDHSRQGSQDYRQPSHDHLRGQNEAHNLIVPDVGNESDDYEPPEPDSPVDDQAVSMESEGFTPKSPTPPIDNVSHQQAHSLSSPQPIRLLSQSSEQNGYNPTTNREESVVDKVCAPSLVYSISDSILGSSRDS